MRVGWRALASVAAGLTGVLAVAGLSALGSWPPVATVLSDSMDPAIGVGDLVVLARGAPRAGDVVRVRVPDDARRLGYPSVVVHRVVEALPDGTLRTKGDNLADPDPFVIGPSAIEGRVVATVPGVGRVVSFLLSPLGVLWLGAGVLVLVVVPLWETARERGTLQRVELLALAEIRQRLDRLAADEGDPAGAVVLRGVRVERRDGEVRVLRS